MTFSEKPADDHPIVAEGGLVRPPHIHDDPFAALDDLSAVVEILCPIWPPRPLRSHRGDYRL